VDAGRPRRDVPWRDIPVPVDPQTEAPEVDPEAFARRILLDQLTGRARSRAELAGQLAKKGVPDELARRLRHRGRGG
jgi:regulatory protein